MPGCELGERDEELEKAKAENTGRRCGGVCLESQYFGELRPEDSKF